MSGGFIDNPEVLLETARAKQSLVDNTVTFYDKASSTGSPQKTTKTTAVHFWYLNTDGASNNTPHYSQSLGRVHDYTEAVVNSVDGRREVDEKDYQKPDGKYRAIVKLFLLYENQKTLRDDEASWPMATGWLVKEDIVVTAGHCAYDHSHNLGRLVKVKAYVGYRGRKTVGDSERVEHQCGTAVATTSGWINTTGGEEASDVSLIKLSKPFKTAGNCFKWTQTPIAQTAAGLGVVGYPGDIIDDGERGARMYEMFRNTDYNLQSSDLHMLEYKIDTYGGNSGSPVFNDKKSLTAIGVHVLGGYSRNSASVFDGPWGNRFEALKNIASRLSTIEEKSKDATNPDKDRPWLWMLHETTTESEDDDPVHLGLVDTTRKALKLIADIPGDILNADTSALGLSFGPDAGPQISILASTAIAAAGRLAADSGNPSHAEALANSRPYDGIIGRAILAEAALQYHFKTKLSLKDREKVTEFLGPVVASLKPFVMNVAPRILQGVLEPSMRLLLSHMISESKLDTDDVRKRRSLTAEKDTGLGRKLDDKEAAFVEALLERVGQSEAESFYSTLTTIGDVIGSAFKKAGPILNEAARIGLPLLLGTESDVAQPKTNLNALAHRAILAEACLQAYVSLQDDLKLGEEGLFNAMATSVKKMGPRLVKVAPFMVKFVGPVVAGLLREMQDKRKEKEKRKEFLDFTYGK
ncbi:extracellular metalloprotease [Fusarium sp. NRRL 52700]|nr:extracellular metalloprotease [Fusarium sp. NRRL 52700]